MCPTCKSSAIRTKPSVGSTPVYECASCSMVFMTEPPAKDLYSSNYFKGSESAGYENYQSEFPAHYRSFQSRLLRTQKILGRIGRLLDIGCALGHCGKAAHDLGWVTYVTDVSEFAAKEAAKKFSLRSFVSPAGKLPIRDQSFDCVTLFDVLEHVNDPVPFLTEIRRTVRRGGVLQITTPNIKSWTARLMGPKWYHFKPGEHFLYFNKSTLTRALNRSGFEVIRIEALPMSMRIGDVLKRVRRYWPAGVNVALKIAERLKLADKVIVLYAGEMQAWATPANTLALPISTEVFQCPSCAGEIKTGKAEAVCKSCNATFASTGGVINFGESRPAYSIAS